MNDSGLMIFLIKQHLDSDKSFVHYFKRISGICEVHVDRENNDQYLGRSHMLTSFYVHCQALPSSVAQIGVDQVTLRHCHVSGSHHKGALLMAVHEARKRL